MTLRPMSLTMQVQVDPGKPTGEARLLNLAMKAILVVAIVSIVSAVGIAALMLPPPLISVNGFAEPNVQLDPLESFGDNQWAVWVALVSETRDLEDWRAVLVKNGSLEDEMDPLTDGSTTYMSFTDLSGDRKLGSLDFFVITCDPGSSYKLSIVWKDSGNERGSESWET